MNWIWYAVPLTIAVIGTLFFLSGLSRLFSGEAVSGVARLGVGGGVAALGFAGALLGVNMQTFSRLTYESPVAEISVHALDPTQKRFAVTIRRLDGSGHIQACMLQGDAWLLGGRVQKWKPWANALGLNATYTLDQMANKYNSAPEANGKPITACDMVGPPPQVDQYVPKPLLDWLIAQAYVEDRRFGSANYMPLADGAVYKVVMTQSGLNSEPDNDAARAANSAQP